ncbi:hypothetical protein ATN88_16040 [Enterovibrio coralii]|uniref:HTH-like domain-containing protein n=2 Tax=Enterovibrio coralii TaxID=294935 RepID=A0A135I5R1_9GAMM|nr:hypothetical protein ATN88_16040 [Enterovibrio coralii]
MKYPHKSDALLSLKRKMTSLRSGNDFRLTKEAILRIHKDIHRRVYIEIDCLHVNVSASGYCAWLHRSVSKRAQIDKILGERFTLLHKRSEIRYGSPKIHKALKQESVSVGKKRVGRVMKEAVLKARVDRV